MNAFWVRDPVCLCLCLSLRVSVCMVDGVWCLCKYLCVGMRIYVRPCRNMVFTPSLQIAVAEQVEADRNFLEMAPAGQQRQFRFLSPAYITAGTSASE